MSRVQLLTLLFTMALIFCALKVKVEAQTIRAYRAELIVETKSDWTTIHLIDISLVKYHYTIVEGSDAPDLKVHVSSSAICIGKKQFDTTKVVVYISCYIVVGENATIRIDKGDLEYTKIVIYVRTDSKKVKVAEFINQGVVPGSKGINPRVFKLSIADFEKAGAKPVVVVSESKPLKLVLAFYYPWYGNPQGPSGKWFHWNNPPGVSTKDIAASTDYPLLGPYDSWDERVIRAHMKMAKYAGIDGFICSWWGIGGFEDKAFERILKVAEEENFKVTIYYESVRDISVNQIIEELSYVLSKYSKSPAFLKIDGKPVIFIYAVGAKGRTVSDWQKVVEEVEKKTGIDAIFIGDTFSVDFLQAFDGLHTYNPIWIKDPVETYTKEASAVKNYIPPDVLEKGEEFKPKLFAASVVPGYDDRKIRKPGGYVPRNDGKYYEKMWTGALACNPDMILITTWNEWHEGTEIEPSREYGFKYIKMTRTFVEKYKGVQLPQPSQPKLVVEQEVKPKKVTGAEAPVITLKLKNVGKGPAVIVHVHLNLPKEAEVMRTNFYSLDLDNPRLVIVPYIAPGEEVTVVIKFAYPKKGTVNVGADVTYYSVDGNKYEVQVNPVTVTFETEVKKTEEEEVVSTSTLDPLILVAAGLALLALIIIVFIILKKR